MFWVEVLKYSEKYLKFSSNLHKSLFILLQFIERNKAYEHQQREQDGYFKKQIKNRNFLKNLKFGGKREWIDYPFKKPMKAAKTGRTDVQNKKQHSPTNKKKLKWSRRLLVIIFRFWCQSCQTDPAFTGTHVPLRISSSELRRNTINIFSPRKKRAFRLFRTVSNQKCSFAILRETRIPCSLFHLGHTRSQNKNRKNDLICLPRGKRRAFESPTRVCPLIAFSSPAHAKRLVQRGRLIRRIENGERCARRGFLAARGTVKMRRRYKLAAARSATV